MKSLRDSWVESERAARGIIVKLTEYAIINEINAINQRKIVKDVLLSFFLFLIFKIRNKLQ